MRLQRGISVFAGLVVALSTLSACSSSPPQHAASPCRVATPTPTVSLADRAPIVPSTGAYFGGFALTGAATQTNLVSSFAAFGQQLCRPLGLAHDYLRWNTTFPTPAAEVFARQGVPQLVSWTGTNIETINSGAVDHTIAATARQIASLHSPVFLEFRWEMDRANLATYVHSPAAYVEAWDRVRRIFAQVGTPNVSWVWCPTAAGFVSGRAQQFYPGDNEVDWVCTDAYPVPGAGSAYQPMRHLIRPFLDWTHQHDKPVMIGEFGVPQSYTPAQQVAWLNDARTTFTQGRRIKAVAYFNYDPVGNPPYLRYRIGTNPRVVAALRAMANDPYFRLPDAS